MKKVLLSILAFIYLANVSGASLQFHYCMGKLVRIGVIQEKNKPCSHCGMKKAAAVADGCCKDEHKSFSPDKSQKAITESFKQLSMTMALVHSPEVITQPVSLSSELASSYPVSNAPPISRPLYLVNRVFLI